MGDLFLRAHVAGNAGRLYASETGNKLAKISGLDPAGPLFTVPLPVPKLNKENALFVDIIHTNMGGLGDVGVLGSGHVNFFPNGGVSQPGCNVTDGKSTAEGVMNFYMNCYNYSGMQSSICRGAVCGLNFQGFPSL